MAYGTNLHAYLQGATQNANATLILARIVYYHRYGKGRLIDGVKWTPNSTEDWGRESRLSRQQARAAFTIYKARNLVETMVMKTAHGTLLHTRPTARALAIAAGAEEGGAGCPQFEGGLPAVQGEVGWQPISEGDTQGVTQGVKKDSEPTPNGVASPEPPEFEQGSGQDHKEPETMDMTDSLKAALGKKLMHKPDSVKALEQIWKDRMHEITGATIVLGGKEYGQLKLFKAKCPPGQCEAVLRKVLGHWLGFAKAVAASAGQKTVPEKPKLSFLLLFATDAVIWATPKVQSLAPKAPEHEAPKAIFPATPVQLSSKPKNYPKTLEELMAPPKVD